MGRFDTHPRGLSYLLQKITNRELALPDFQRSFVWDPNQTEMLIESIASGFPAGSLLFARNRPDFLAIREFEGAPELGDAKPNEIVLDGQQRLTSLYQALMGSGEYEYFVAIRHLLDDDVEAAVFHESRKRAERKGLGKIEVQARDLLLPIPRLFENNGFGKWRDQVLALRDDGDELGPRLWDVHSKWLSNIESYQFPVVTLSEDTSLEAICNIFETLNNTGVRLSVFELLTARFWPSGVDLRGLLEEARADSDMLDAFGLDPYYLLQVLALRGGKNSCTRSSVLKLSPDEVTEHWSAAVSGVDGALRFFRDHCGVVRAGWLPYVPMLLPLAALWPEHVASVAGPNQATRRSRLSTWYWRSVLGQQYENATNTKALKDYREIPIWLEGGAAPQSVAEFRFDQRLRDITHRQRAVYRGLVGLMATRGALDFHNAEPLSWNKVHNQEINDHHVFPQAWLRDEMPSIPSRLRDTILNRALIDKITNIRIGRRAPSDYIEEMAKELGESLLSEILGSHFLPSDPDGPLRLDQFEDFLDQREGWLLEEIATVTDVAVEQLTPTSAVDGEP